MKRFLFAVAALALLFVLAACGHTALSATAAAENTPGTTPTSSTSRNVRNSPVTVTETYANTDVVSGTTTATETSSTTPATTPAESTAATAESTASPADTPATGDFPITYFAGVLGLILVCSAGLVMLKRI